MATTISCVQYYEVINSGTAAVAAGDFVSFSTLGTSSGTLSVTAQSATTFGVNVTSPDSFFSTYRITWQVPVANSGELGIYCPQLGGLLPGSVMGTSWGHSQIVGDYIFSTNDNTQTFQISIQNPSANNSSINLLSHGSGNVDVAVSIIFQYVGGT